MKKTTFSVIWLSGIAAIVLLLNFAGSKIMLHYAYSELVPAISDYASKYDSLIQPDINDSEKNGLKYFSLRSVLSDDNLKANTNIISTLCFAGTNTELSIDFFDKNGFNTNSSGCFAYAYLDCDDSPSFNNITGIVCINRFIEQDIAKKIIPELEKKPDAIIRLNSYTIDEYYNITPVSITLTDDDGHEIITAEQSYSGNLIQQDNCLIKNVYFSNCPIEENQDSVIYKIKIAEKGTRKVDIIADSYNKQVKFDNGDYSNYNIKKGFGNLVYKFCDVVDNKAEVIVLYSNFTDILIIDSIILGTIYTIILLLACKMVRKGRKNQSLNPLT